MVCIGELGPRGGTQGHMETHLLCTCGKSHACPSGLHVGSFCMQDPPETHMVTPSSTEGDGGVRVAASAQTDKHTSSTPNMHQMSVNCQSSGTQRPLCAHGNPKACLGGGGEHSPLDSETGEGLRFTPPPAPCPRGKEELYPTSVLSTHLTLAPHSSCHPHTGSLGAQGGPEGPLPRACGISMATLEWWEWRSAPPVAVARASDKTAKLLWLRAASTSAHPHPMCPWHKRWCPTAVWLFLEGQ